MARRPPAWNLDAFEAILAKHLALHGLTSKDFAASVPMSPGALADIRNLQSTGAPRRTPSGPLIKKLADALGVPPGALQGSIEALAS